MDIYDRPANKEVVSYLNQGALLPGQVEGASVRTSLGIHKLNKSIINRDVSVWIRPDQVYLDTQTNDLVHVERFEFVGSHSRITARTNEGHLFTFHVSQREDLTGQRVGVRVEGNVHILPVEKP